MILKKAVKTHPYTLLLIVNLIKCMPNSQRCGDTPLLMRNIVLSYTVERQMQQVDFILCKVKHCYAGDNYES